MLYERELAIVSIPSEITTNRLPLSANLVNYFARDSMRIAKQFKEYHRFEYREYYSDNEYKVIHSFVVDEDYVHIDVE